MLGIAVACNPSALPRIPQCLAYIRAFFFSLLVVSIHFIPSSNIIFEMHITVNPTGRYLEGKDEEILYHRMRDEMIMKREEGVFQSYPNSDSTSHIHPNLVNR